MNQRESRWQAERLHGVASHLLSRQFLAELFLQTLKMEAICSYETSVDTQQTTPRYITEVGTLQLSLTVIKMHIVVFCCLTFLWCVVNT
jgi:hypothetical protein